MADHLAADDDLDGGATYLIQVRAWGGTSEQLAELFDAVADAAHGYGEDHGIDVMCAGTANPT